MSTKLKRTSMALDAETLEALDSLSKKWGVSKAEVMRRSIRDMRTEEIKKEEKESDLPKTPLEALLWLRENGGLSLEQAEKFKAEVNAERKVWRKDPWEEWEKQQKKKSA